MAASPTLLDQLRKVTPTTFEHITYDVLVSAGLRNAVWRTPGADGGRDIEGDFPATDLSGALHLQRWYIECKRHAATLDWPTVYGKIAYAANQDADFLLLVTTAHLSPQCKSEISAHEASRRTPRIRAWDATSIERAVSQFPQVLIKHGLFAPEKQIIEGILPLSLAVSRACQAAYGEASGGSPSPALEFAAAIGELLWVRVDSATKGIVLSADAFDSTDDSYPWFTVDAGIDLSVIDRHSLRALLTAFRYVTGAKTVSIKARSTGTMRAVRLHTSDGRWPCNGNHADSLLREVAFWSTAMVHAIDVNGIDLELP